LGRPAKPNFAGTAKQAIGAASAHFENVFCEIFVMKTLKLIEEEETRVIDA